MKRVDHVTQLLLSCALAAGLAATPSSGDPISPETGRIQTSAIEEFLPVSIPEESAQLKSYSRFAGDVDNLAVEEYLGVAKSFYWYAGRFLNAEILPDAAFLREHLLLVPSGDRALGGLREDVAFLRYRAKSLDILLVQTASRLRVFLVGSALGQAPDSITSEWIVEYVLEAYLNTNQLRPFTIESKVAGEQVLARGFDKEHPRWTRFSILFTQGYLSFVISKVQPSDTVPSRPPLPEEWFSRRKDWRKDIPLENFRTHDRSLLRRSSTNTADTTWSRELAEAIQEKDMKVLVEFASGSSRAHSRMACEALAKTPEGRAAIAGLLIKGQARSPKVVLAPLLHAEAPDVPALLSQVAAATDNADLFEEAIEGVIKSMPEAEAKKFCLEQARKLADGPDASAEKLMFFIRGLRQDDDPPEVKVLRQILRRTQNEELRTACLHILSKWITDASEVRGDILRILKERIADESFAVRASAARALGESGDVRHVRLLMPLLDDQDKHVRRTTAKAICRLLGWEIPRTDTAEAEKEWLDKLKDRLEPVMKVVDDLATVIQETRRE